MFTLDELDSLVKEYLATLNDTTFDESYCTERMMAEAEVLLFLDWLRSEK